MKKIKVELEDIKETIKEFYEPKVWHFLTINGVAIKDETVEIQWIFAKYEAMNETVVYFCEVDYSTPIPSIADIIPSAMISQREVVDMFGVEIENSEKGLYLDEDSLQKPLSGCSL
ncbi:MAG: NADH-quinone oxidoreductase subunit C [Campylobacterota bacterium]|nr:NADH-quinone oxidoreductase subunit C [Campylobacterota bacterium]